METLAAKTLVLNLAWEHSLEIHSLTTDRAKDMKTLMRWVSPVFEAALMVLNQKCTDIATT